MEKQVQRFFIVREQLLKNIIYNRLLTNKIAQYRRPFPVANAVIRFNEKTKSEMRKQETRKKLPAKGMHEIFVQYITFDAHIGISYLAFPIAWERYPSQININTPSGLKKLAAFIYKAYPIHPAKADTIFSKAPKGFDEFLEHYNTSRNWWKSGYSKPFVSQKECLDEKTFDEYEKALIRRNEDYRIFNKLLIELLKNGSVKIEKPGVGALELSKGEMNKNLMYIKFESYLENTIASDIIPYDTFSPRFFSNSRIDILALRSLLN